MDVQIPKSINAGLNKELILFSQALEQCESKECIAKLVLNVLARVVKVKFLSFVSRLDNEDELEVVCQLGDELFARQVQNLFSKNTSLEIYNWVFEQNKIITLQLANKEKYIFIPFQDTSCNKHKYGVVLMLLDTSNDEISSDVKCFIDIINRLSCLYLTRHILKSNLGNVQANHENFNEDIKLASLIQRSLSNFSLNNKICFSVLEDANAAINGNLWWTCELTPDIVTVCMAKAKINLNSHNYSSSMVAGYLLGEMNGLKTKADLSLNPVEVLKYLNKQLNTLFKNAAVTVDAWYGVINIGARKITFANANYPEPYIIGPEQQVGRLIPRGGNKGNSLGINLDSVYKEDTSFLPYKSRLVICTQELLERVSKIGDKYDPYWFSQVLETIGNLSLSEMKNSLDNILQDKKNGTGLKPSRLALLLELPS